MDGLVERNAYLCSGLPRGYIVMRKTKDMPLLLFRLSNTFRVTIATHDVDKSHMAVFLKSWRSFLNEEHTCSDECSYLESVITCALKALNESLSCLLEGDSIFTTQFDTCCIDEVDDQQVRLTFFSYFLGNLRLHGFSLRFWPKIKQLPSLRLVIFYKNQPIITIT